jgi:flagellar protein FliO/FliZ
MLRFSRAWLPGVLVLCAASVLFAQTADDRYLLPTDPAPTGSNLASEQATPAPPAWNDGASVYLTAREQAAAAETAPVASPLVVNDPRVAQAEYLQDERPAESAEPPQRQLAPPNDARGENARQPSPATIMTKGWGLPLDSLVTTITALVLVVGLFLLCMWALRRGSRVASGHLPPDAVSVLGSMPLVGRQAAQLLRVGNKLVLISLTPSGAQPLLEVTDPAEVDRLMGLCLQGDLRSAARGHERAFRPLANEPTLKSLPTLDLPLAKTPSASDLFRAYQGGTERA